MSSWSSYDLERRRAAVECLVKRRGARAVASAAGVLLMTVDSWRHGILSVSDSDLDKLYAAFGQELIDCLQVRTSAGARRIGRRALLIGIGAGATALLAAYYLRPLIRLGRLLGSLATGAPVLPTSLPGTLSNNGGVVLSDGEMAFQLLPGERGDYALLRGNELRVIPDNADVMPNVDYSNITGSQIVNSRYFFGGGENSISPWSPCAFPCAPYIAVYSGSDLRIIKVPSGSCDNMNFTGVAYDGEHYYAFGGANVGTETGWTGVVVFDGSLKIVAMNGLTPMDDAGNQLNMYRSGPKQYLKGRIYTLAYDGSRLLLESIPASIRNAGSVCWQSNIQPTFERFIAGDFSQWAIPVLGSDLSVAYFNSSSVVWVGPEGGEMDVVRVPNPSGNVFIKLVDGRLFVANQDGGVFKVLSPTYKEFKGLGFIDWRGYAAVFSSLRMGASVSITPVA